MTSIVFVHGMWCRPFVWDTFRAPFEQAGYRVYTPTLLFHDADPTQRPVAGIGGASLRDYVAQISNMVRELPEPPVLVGHSMGGLIVQLVAEQAPTRGVVALATSPPGNFFAITPSAVKIFWPSLLRWGHWYKPQRPSFRRMRWGVLQNLAEHEARRLYDQLVWESGRALVEIAYGFTRFSDAAWIDPTKSAVPKLFVTGSDDRICAWQAAERTARMHDAPFERVDGMAHWLIGEPGWEAVADRVLEFVSGARTSTN